MSISTEQICNQISDCLLPNKKFKATSLLIKRTIKSLYENQSISYNNEQKKFEIEGLDEEQIWFQIKNQVKKQQKKIFNINNFENIIQELQDIKQLEKQKNKKKQVEPEVNMDDDQLSQEQEIEQEELENDQFSDNQENNQEESYQKEDLDGFLNFADTLDSGKKNKDSYAQLYEQVQSLDDEQEEDYEEDSDEMDANSAIFNEQHDDYEEDSQKSESDDNSQNDLIDQDIENDVFDDQREKQIEQTKKKTKLDEQIDKLEDKLIQKKSWQLQGEVSSKSRPVNSLLEEHLDFKQASKQEVQVTKEFTENLEKIIKQRILDEAWDDRTVIILKKLVIPADSIQETFNSLGDLNFEKNKLGLSEEYENQFKKDVLNLTSNTEEDKLRREIEYAFKTLSYTLDNLSNLNFTPKSVVEQAQIISNIPSMKKEEKIPIFVSEKMQKAPQELFDPSKQGRFESKIELNAEENQKNHRTKLTTIRAKIQKKKKKELFKKLDYSGQTKFIHNQVSKADSKLKKQVQNKKEQSVTFTKSNQFFKNLQNKMDNKQIDTKPEKQKNFKL